MKPTLVYAFHRFSCSSLTRIQYLPIPCDLQLASMDIPASFQTTASVLASLFAWDADEAASHFLVMQCEVVKHGPRVPVLVVSINPVDSPAKKKRKTTSPTKPPIVHDGRKGPACQKCDGKNTEHLRFHGTSNFKAVMADGFKLKPSGKPDREKGETPGIFHYGEEQWAKAFQYSGPQTLACEGLEKTPFLRIVCVVQTMCWKKCSGCDWGKTNALCDRYAVTSLRIIQHIHSAGLPKYYDLEEVQDHTLSIRSNPIRSDLLPAQPGSSSASLPTPPHTARHSQSRHDEVQPCPLWSILIDSNRF